MLNVEKVKSMTKAAAYENGLEKKNIEISSYYRTDYLGLQMLKSGVAYTVSFGILILLWAMGRMETLLLMISDRDYREVFIRTMILLFTAGLIAYEIAVYSYYSKRHRNAKKSVGKYQSHLKHIYKIYQAQESDENFNIKISADEENTL